MGGKPVIKGTRITVAHILELLGDGWSESEVLSSCPGLTEEHMRAAQACAAAYFELGVTVLFHVGIA